MSADVSTAALVKAAAEEVRRRQKLVLRAAVEEVRRRQQLMVSAAAETLQHRECLLVEAARRTVAELREARSVPTPVVNVAAPHVVVDPIVNVSAPTVNVEVDTEGLASCVNKLAEAVETLVEVAVQALSRRQPTPRLVLPIRPLRTLIIHHEDGTQSVVTETKEVADE